VHNLGSEFLGQAQKRPHIGGTGSFLESISAWGYANTSTLPGSWHPAKTHLLHIQKIVTRGGSAVIHICIIADQSRR